MNENIDKMKLNMEELNKVAGGSDNYYIGTDWYRWEDKGDSMRYFYDQAGNLLGVASFEFLEQNYDKYGDWHLPGNDPDEWRQYYDRLDR